jgi:DNA-binding NarL/FixJ family response regulator
MSAAGRGRTHLSVTLVAGRTLRAQCLARFLELSGLTIRIVALEHLHEDLVAQSGVVDVAVIDIGEQTCRDPDTRRSFAQLREVLPNVPIVVVSDRGGLSTVLAALNLGARAYFPSSQDPDILVETLRFVQKGGTFIPFDVLIRAPVHRTRSPGAEAKRTAVGGLTPSEQRVLDLLKKGKPNKAIARELDIEETTVKVHVRRIMKKLHAANRTQAALAAQQMADVVDVMAIYANNRRGRVRSDGRRLE